MFFIVNLRYLYTENSFQKKDNIDALRNYCRMRKMQFMCARLSIHRLAEIEKQRIELEKLFNKTLQIRNNTKTTQRRPLPNIEK